MYRNTDGQKTCETGELVSIGACMLHIDCHKIFDGFRSHPEVHLQCSRRRE